MTLTLSLFIIFAVFAALVMLAKRTRASGSGDEPWPFYAKKPLSAPELILYERLGRALPDRIVLAQASLGRMLGVKKGKNFGEWFNRINRMSADFVVCSKDGAVVAVIELDDASHDRADRKMADAKKDKALASAGIRIVRWQARSLPDEVLIKTTFTPAQPMVQADGHAPGH